MKRILAALIALALFIACCPILPLGANATVIKTGSCGKNVTWSLDSTGILAISGAGPMNDYSSSEYPFGNEAASVRQVVVETGVTTIGSYIFQGLSNLTEITIPDGVTVIGNYAFSNCSKLTSVTIPDTVTRIEHYAFHNCYGLEELTIPGSVTFIGESSFANCHGLPYTFYDYGKYLGNQENPYHALISGQYSNLAPDSIHKDTKVIAGGAFKKCESIVSADIPNGVTTIGDSAFYGCTALAEVEIPDSIISIHGNAFYNCPETVFQVYDNAMYMGNGENPYHVLMSSANDLITSNRIHETTKVVAAAAFASCNKLEEIEIPNRVTHIGDYAFACCNYLTQAKIGGGNTAMEVAEGFTVTGYDPAIIGEQWVTVVYEKCTTTLPVVVQKPYPLELTVDASAAKIAYWPGEALDTEGLVLTAVMSDGTVKQVTDGYTVTGYDPAVPGVQNVTVSCDGAAATYQVSVYVAADNAGNGYVLLAEATAKANTLVLLGNTAEAFAVDQNITLDLNGYTISGDVTVAKGCSLRIKDSQTDDYTVEDEAGYGKVMKITGNVAAVDGYLQISEAEGVSFHKVDLVPTSVTLRAEQVGIYYNGEFFGDEVVAENVDRFGIALRLDAVPNATYMKTSSAYSWYKGFVAGTDGNKAYGTLLKNIMKQGVANSENMERSQNKIYGRAYILTKDGRYIFGDSVGYSMMQVMQKVDARWSELTQNQKNAVKALYNRFEGVIGNWYLPNINDTDIDIPI